MARQKVKTRRISDIRLRAPAGKEGFYEGWTAAKAWGLGPCRFTMEGMIQRISLLVLGLVLTCGVAGGMGSKQYSDMHFVVLRDSNQKPIRNAAVILHPVTSKGKQKRGSLELKTDAEGRCGFDGVPYGKLRIQVIAPGYQTFGEDYDIDQPTHEIVIKMQKPKAQVTIY